ncbi:pappalysin-1-like [Lingula anatina]|uniref:Pappalysin-1-like n=1 Tax=Lingula anatina TaxID=7574 RepID=A0A1S3IPY2_LINAN|nr:pappalysin-1-like [Lingula anatina]|eukprot:XP_013400123.1 pappalysin-1-like [Lingula anatina]
MSGGKVISLANHNIKPSSRHLSSSLRRSTSLGTESSFQFLGVQERREASTMMTSSVCSLVLLKYSLIFTVLLLVTVKIPPCEGGSVEDYHRRYGERARAAWLAATQHRRDMRRLGGASHRRSDVSRDLQVHPTSHHRHSREVHESADEYLSHQSLGRHRRHVDGSGRGSSTARGGKYGHALLFTGDAQVLRLKPSGRNVAFEIPKNDFTVEFWLKPEGGQLDEVPIVGVFDTCVTETGQRHPGTWQIGIKATRKNERKDARIFFSLYTERSRKGTLLTSSRNYIPEKWVHVAAVYANHKMKFYLDGAKVATDTTQRGDIFSEPYHRCKQFEIGGDAIAKRYFRGSLDEIRLWRKGLHHSEIVRQMFEGKTTARHQNLVISSNFNTLTGWELEDGHNEPLRVYSTIDDHRFDMALTTPPCGRTVCDDPDVVRSYVAHPELRAPKELRYRLINVYDDDGTNPSVSSSQILEQHAMLQDAFLRYDISWTYEVKVVKSSSMRKRKVLRECDPAKIGDNKCDRNCNFTTTGYDGGDCLSLPCDQEQIGNHYCDLNCNQYRYGWDGGDCCETGDRGHCIDPESPHRTYLTLSEYKSMLNISSKSHLNVFVPELIAASILGQATYPWEKGALEEQGGVVIDASRYGRPGFMSTLVHEVGHVLGLLHVHHGVSDLRCDDQCAESRPSLELGDLCSDTNPTPMNSKCRDPDEVTCSGTVYKNTPYRNYMSYAEGDNCTDHFTPQQVARLHCYADLRYGTWMTGREPSPIPIAPRILNTAADTVTLAWIPPLNTQNGDDVSQYCSLCHQDDSLGQYATSATSSNPGNLTVMVTPDEVLGAPDADRCTPSQGIWFSEQDFCDMDCFIDVGFSVPVIPTRLLLWVTWNTVDAIADVELHFIDGATVSLGPITVFCDMPFTTHLDVNQKVNKVCAFC